MKNDPKKILITDDVHPLLIEGFQKRGYECDYLPNITYEECKMMIHAYEGLIINSKIVVDAAFLALAPSLRFVGRLGSGMEIVDKETAKVNGVAVFSSPEGNRNAVAEHALGMLLALANNLVRSDQEVRQTVWNREKNRGFELFHKTIGIIGFGHTGSAFASKLLGLGMQVLTYDKYLPKGYSDEYSHITETTLENLWQHADIISLHLPLTAETKHMVNAAFLEKCKEGIIIVNTSRGKVVHTTDLVTFLENGRIGGVCLDVFENEKPHTFSPEEEALYARLYALPNTVLSPHIAGWTQESKQRLSEVLLQKISTIL